MTGTAINKTPNRTHSPNHTIVLNKVKYGWVYLVRQRMWCHTHLESERKSQITCGCFIYKLTGACCVRVGGVSYRCSSRNMVRFWCGCRFGSRRGTNNEGTRRSDRPKTSESRLSTKENRDKFVYCHQFINTPTTMEW